MLTWDPPDERYFEHGLDHGVLYIPGIDPVPWNGLSGFEEGSSGSNSVLYRDGVIYLADAEASDFSGKLNAVFFPNEFHECLGMPEVTDGLYVDNQKPKRFGLSYRTLIGNGSTDDLFGHQIHLVYNCVASIAPRSRTSIGADVSPVDFSFDVVCTPVRLAGFRPTAHFIIDTRTMSPGTIAQLQDILYGTDTVPGSLPDPQVLFDLMNFGDAMTVVLHADGYFTVEGSSENLQAVGPDGFVMNNINGVDIGGGYYTLSTGGNTDVTIEG